MSKPLLNKFTGHLKQSLKTAFKLATDLKQTEVTPLCLLYGLVLEKGSIAGEILRKEKIDKNKIISFLLDYPEPVVQSLPTMSSAGEKILEKAALCSFKNRHRYIGTEHLLWALLENPGEKILEFLENFQINIINIDEELTNIIASTNRFPEISSLLNNMQPAEMPFGSSLSPLAQTPGKNKKNSVLGHFTADLTSAQAAKNMDPIIGREKEITRLIQILCRRQKNNPVLLGDPGVGKTAIVEGLAARIVLGDVPDELQNKKVLRLDLGLLIAGTIYRGEFENRLKQLMEEIKNDPNLIIFIDEMHTIVGAGSASGTLDAANILKPALARGEMRCIGATTFEEYKKHIESDPALERRFQPIVVAEPNLEETREILKGVSKNYETFHGIKITAEAINEAVSLADRYYPEKFFPDKALDLIDEASAAKKLSYAGQSYIKKIKILKKELQEVQQQKEQAILNEAFAKAGQNKKAEDKILKQIEQLEKQNKAKTIRPKGELLAVDIKKIISQTLNIPFEELETEETDFFKKLEEKIKQKIIGQDEAVQKISQTLRRHRLGLGNPNRPIASFIFVGPSGVGKTELAKVLAAEYFPEQSGRSNFIRLDMSEFGESFHSSKLVGAPAGYIGYKDSNSLADKIKNHPYSVVLLDEIDKAHSDIFNLFLQILDEGHLTDAGGKKINFKNTIVVMTANLNEEIFKNQTLGFGDNSINPASKTININVKEELKRRFRTDFLNRLDQIIIFNSLNEENLEKIIKLQIDSLNKKLSQKNIEIQVTNAAVNFLTNLSQKNEQGARGVNKIISENLEEKLGTWLMENKNKSTKKIIFNLEDGEIKIII
ncbi:MAG: ATPase AAA-2 domain protein [Candidatus Magasanikbacteria bacterium GW2011_GWC2_40_17]|uniref:ATPase AAA-2 domain protein n=1 Tax=Candidatus Magasanikbacteria bacterium GW2011_GWA2_42_32 TaxID=1619039 RepID=A0A0G1A719_9BACT|nr:MAG: ATPase AAA-2 domain protein [Candidatus Magasanikbacteria bacterium GW2011_GWC2_40_17]KKS56749.1 MAG: ATPase AAA-2 domain protein [Candidatus Magasanikbacteria bacterium GW2011_GWA2_42_32]OGH86062.1 MAG: hypothetical protein A2294_02255 [Candidatus Magasanikbacteria bacterium RIFOXYB2_FULL_38_10]